MNKDIDYLLYGFPFIIPCEYKKINNDKKKENFNLII